MSNNLFSQSRLIWTPKDPRLTRVEALRRMINHKHGLNLKDYHDLHKYSIEDYTFWKDLWDFLGVIYSVPPSAVIEPGRAPYLPNWFPGARLNYSENLLWRNDDAIAVTAANEDGLVVHYSFRELRDHVRVVSSALRAAGVQVGDRVAAIVSNSYHAIVLALSSGVVGGVFSSTATDMGSKGILERYRQIRPVIIFAETQAHYAGKNIDLVPKVSEVINSLKDHGLKHAVLLPNPRTGSIAPHALNEIKSVETFESFSKRGERGTLVFEQLPFSAPLYILYSSGTSGPPKCIIHCAGGVLLQNKKDGGLGFSMSPDDTYFQYTTTGWMMWPFMLSILGSGARIIAYDGSPFYPDVTKFLKFVSDQRVNVLGISPRFLAEVQGRGVNPLQVAPFESLRVLFCTGAVLTAPMFEWSQQAFGDVHILSGSGGTDICSSFVGGVASMPVYAGEIQAKVLGMAVEIFSPEGKNIEETGEPGELVCVRPHPSLPIGFFGDESGEKLRKAYFDMYPGVWRQGDFIALNPRTRGLMILGRSDGVLNPSGVRFGSAEIYAVMERFMNADHGVNDALCVGQRRAERGENDERVMLFLKMAEVGPEGTLGTGSKKKRLTKKLENEIRQAIRDALSARHVPAHIFEVDDIPYTVNNKKIEIAVKQIVSSGPGALKPSGTVANPESLQLYYKFYDFEKIAEEEERKKEAAELEDALGSRDLKAKL